MLWNQPSNSLASESKSHRKQWKAENVFFRYCLSVVLTSTVYLLSNISAKVGCSREYYSGKKKNHTFKNQVITLPKGADIVDVEVGEKGPTSDIALFRQQQKFADTQGFSGDKAYAGAERTTTPHKKPRKGELTAEQLSDNKIISSQRIFIEHVIRLLKIFRVAKERFRLHPSSYEQVILTICGLVRLRIGTLILPV